MGITYVSWIAPDSGPAPFACVTALDPSSAASMFSDLDGTPAAVNDPVRRMLDAKYGGHAYYNPDTGAEEHLAANCSRGSVFAFTGQRMTSPYTCGQKRRDTGDYATRQRSSYASRWH